MSTGYTYTDRSGRPIGIDTLGEEVWLAVPKGNLFIDNTDAPTVAAEILKAAGQDGVFIPKAYEEVERLGDELTCGSGPEWAGATIHANPNWLRNRAANCIALAEYIENKDQREVEADKKLQERRDAVTREIMRNDEGLPIGDYASLNWYAKKAVDRIIELATILEGGQVK